MSWVTVVVEQRLALALQVAPHGSAVKSREDLRGTEDKSKSQVEK